MACILAIDQSAPPLWSGWYLKRFSLEALHNIYVRGGAGHFKELIVAYRLCWNSSCLVASVMSLLVVRVGVVTLEMGHLSRSTCSRRISRTLSGILFLVPGIASNRFLL